MTIATIPESRRLPTFIFADCAHILIFAVSFSLPPQFRTPHRHFAACRYRTYCTCSISARAPTPVATTDASGARRVNFASPDFFRSLADFARIDSSISSQLPTTLATPENIQAELAA
jgi:hypothetical protein